MPPQIENLMKNLAQIAALKTKLAGMRDDLHNMAFSEFPLDALVAQSNKIRALKTKITKMENAR